mmetsp:Transcript_25720/g.59455  ORF Transcript_25720/g.59455 Transcript_25720/m.59455 type:complete len:278 (+) Transcript_25720:51-884(+)
MQLGRQRWPDLRMRCILALVCCSYGALGSLRVRSLPADCDDDALKLSWIPHGKPPPLPAVLPEPIEPPKPPPPQPGLPPVPPAAGTMVRAPPPSECRSWPCPASAADGTYLAPPAQPDILEEALGIKPHTPTRAVVDATQQQAQERREERLAEVFPKKLLDEVPPLPLGPPPPVPAKLEALETMPTKEQLLRQSVQQKAEIRELKDEVRTLAEELKETKESLISWQQPPPQPAAWYKAALEPPDPPPLPLGFPMPMASAPGANPGSMLPCPPAGCVH